MAELRIGLLSEEQLGAAREAADTASLPFRIEPKTQVIDPISWIIIGGGALLAGKFVVDLCARLKGGVLIDLRADASKVVRRDKDIPAGWAIVLAVDGTVEIEVHGAAEDSAERLLSKIIDGGFNTVKDVASEAVKELGPAKVKELPQ